MIRESIFQHLVGMVRANSQETFITAKPGTPLDVLNGTLAINCKGMESVELNDLQDRIRRSSMAADLSGIERHGVELGAIARFVSNNLSATINNARNVVTPIVRELTERVEERRAEILSGRAYDREIRIVDVSNVYASPFLESLLSRHRQKTSTDKPLSTATAQMLMRDMTSERMLAILKAGNDAMDQDLEGLLSMVEDDSTLLQRLVEDVNGYLLSDTINFTSIGWSPLIDHRPLCAYLFVLGVNTGRHGAVDMTPELTREIATALNYFGNRLYYQIEEIHTYIKNRRILAAAITREEPHAPVRVFGPVYRQWLADANGSPEALLGYLSARNVTTVADSGNGSELWAEGGLERLVKQYERQRNTQMAQGRVEANQATTQLIRANLVRQANALIADNEGERLAMIKRINDRMTERPYTDRDDLDLYILRLVCMVADGDRHDSEMFIVVMRQLMCDNENLKPTTAATLAATRILGKWLASQMQKVAQ